MMKEGSNSCGKCTFGQEKKSANFCYSHSCHQRVKVTQNENWATAAGERKNLEVRPSEKMGNFRETASVPFPKYLYTPENQKSNIQRLFPCLCLLSVSIAKEVNELCSPQAPKNNALFCHKGTRRTKAGISGVY